MKKCLFTGMVLDGATMIEHAPPKKIGGRFRSSDVVSSTFNNAAGSTIDAELVSCWRFLTILLQPAMSREHRSEAALPVMPLGATVAHELRPGGGLTRSKTEILERDALTGLPSKFAGPDAGGLRRMADRVGLAGKELLLDVVDPGDGTLGMEETLTNTDAMIGGLKSELTAFDIAHEGSRTWTRTEWTRPTRRLVRDAAEGRPFDVDVALRSLWGIDPRVGAQARLFIKRCGVAALPLDHVLIVSGNAATRTLDATFLVFGHEAMSYRLHGDFRGSDFTEVLCSSPTRNGSQSTYFNVPYGWRLPAEKGLRTLSVGQDPPGIEELGALIQDDRARAASHAAIVGELENIEHLPEFLFNWCFLCRGKGVRFDSVRDYCEQRLLDIYQRDGGDWRSRVKLVIDEEIPSEYSHLPPSVPEKVLMGERESWAEAVAPFYRSAIHRMYTEHGPPMIVRFPRLPEARVSRLKDGGETTMKAKRSRR